MKKEIVVIVALVILGFIVLSVSADSDSETMTIEADIFTQPPLVVSIEVPDYVFLGNVSVGKTNNNKTKVYVNNTGTANIIITPQVKNLSDDIVNYLYFQRRVADSWKQIGNFSFGINASTTGGKEDEYFYMKLDLKDYNGTIDQDIIGYQTDIKFVAMSID